MKTIGAMLIALLLVGCSTTGKRMDVTADDFAVTLAKIELDVRSGELVPGVPNARFEGTGCTAIVRNAKILSSADVVKLLTNLTLKSGDCSLIGSPTGTGSVLLPSNEPIL